MFTSNFPRARRARSDSVEALSQSTRKRHKSSSRSSGAQSSAPSHAESEQDDENLDADHHDVDDLFTVDGDELVVNTAPSE
jgi:hypothetical protein